MRHRKKINHLSRKTAHRRMLLANMASSLILHKRIHTTLAKAKALRMYIEPLITKSKEDSTHSRRVVFSYLQSKEAVTELFRDVSVKVAERPGGYTRIIKIGTRLGDNAEMCMMELVDYNENLLGSDTGDKGKSRRRRGRGGAKKEATKEVEAKKTPAAKQVKPAELKETEDIKEEVVAEEAKAEVVVEAPVEKVEEVVTEEVKEETPAVEEKKEEPVAEEKQDETPKAEAADTSEGEVKKEEDETSEDKKEDI